MSSIAQEVPKCPGYQGYQGYSRYPDPRVDFGGSQLVATKAQLKLNKPSNDKHTGLTDMELGFLGANNLHRLKESALRALELIEI